jgi:MFS family permease
MANEYDIDMLKENSEQIERTESKDHAEVTQDAKFEKRVLRKIDTRLLPILGCLYTIALVDRSNVAVARISGMDEDLDLAQGNRVSVALMVFFIGYILFEIPSNAFIHKLGAANWLAFLAVAWGLVSLGIGFLHNWVGLAVLRALLGVFEAGFFPGKSSVVSINRASFTDNPQAAFTLSLLGTSDMRCRSAWPVSSSQLPHYRLSPTSLRTG